MKTKFTIFFITFAVALAGAGILMAMKYVSLRTIIREQKVIEPKSIKSETTGGKTCEDSDGTNYYEKGESKICDFETREEPGATAPVGCALHEDFCSADSDSVKVTEELYEYYCEKSELKFEKYMCSNGCQDGACVK